jgi:hypothetical protein
MIADSFGHNRCIANYLGVRPIGLWRWDIECLVDVSDSVLVDPEYYPSWDTSNIWQSKRYAVGLRRFYGSAAPLWGNKWVQDIA